MQGSTTVRWACLFRANHLHGRPTAPPANEHRQKDERTGAQADGAATHYTGLPPSFSIMMQPLARLEKNIGGGRVRIEEAGSFPASWCLRLRVKNEKTQKKPPPPLCLFPLSLLCFWLLGALHDPCHRTPKILCSCWLGGWACLPALSYCLMHRVPSCRQRQRIRGPPS